MIITESASSAAVSTGLCVQWQEWPIVNKRAYESASAGILLIGLGVLFLTRVGIWPWILAVIGLAGLPASLAQKRGWYGWQGLFWMIGLAVVFATGLFWPGILILVGLSVLMGALTRESAGSPFSVDDRRADGTRRLWPDDADASEPREPDRSPTTRLNQ